MMFRQQTLFETETFLSGKIKVTQDRHGKRRLIVGGLVQSEYDPKNQITLGVWDEFLKLAQKRHEKVSHVLVLGLGAGTSPRQFFSVFPDAWVTGIEIEPKVIEVGRQFFDMNHPRLKAICANAFDWIRTEEAKKHKYDVICVDMYIGNQLPKQSESEDFIKDIVGLLTKDGSIIFNRLYYTNKKYEADKFIDKLKEIFQHVEVKFVRGTFTAHNILILVSHPI